MSGKSAKQGVTQNVKLQTAPSRASKSKSPPVVVSEPKKARKKSPTAEVAVPPPKPRGAKKSAPPPAPAVDPPAPKRKATAKSAPKRIEPVLPVPTKRPAKAQPAVVPAEVPRRAQKKKELEPPPAKSKRAPKSEPPKPEPQKAPPPEEKKPPKLRAEESKRRPGRPRKETLPTEPPAQTSTAQTSTAQRSIAQRSIAQTTVQKSTAQTSTAQSTVQKSTAQTSTVQTSTVQTSTSPVQASVRAPEPSAPKLPPKPPKAKAAEKIEPPKEEPKPAPPKPKVLRIAGGLREKKRAAADLQEALDQLPKREPEHEPRTVKSPPRETHPAVRIPSPKKEINPRLERSKPWNLTPKTPEAPPPEPTEAAPAPAQKPMSVAAKARAKVESVFSKLTGKEAEAPALVEPQEVPFAARPGGQTAFDSPRINPIDSLTTRLRLSHDRDELLAAARELSASHHLPPDPTLLVKVIGLGDPHLTKAALEEMLELHDRGRVRRSPDLARLISGVPAADRETEDLKQLLLAKIGG